MSDRLPEDLLQYLRSNKLDPRQKVLLQELASEYSDDEEHLPAAEYAARYAKREMKIARALGKSSTSLFSMV